MVHFTDEIPGKLLVVEKPLEWQVAGLQYTASGLGAKIPTWYMLKIGKRMHRVYVRQYGNAGSAFIVYKGEKYFLTTDVLIPGEYLY